MNFADNYFLKKVKTENEEIVYINVPVFYEYTRKALIDFEKDLDNDGNLRSLFNGRYNQLLNFDYKQMRIFRDKLP